MIKILFAFAMLFTMFSSTDCSCHEALKEEVMFEAFNNGYKIEITQEETSKLDEMFTAALKGSYPMPALGVSLHDETMKAVQEGIWLRFAFKEPITINELDFDQLLIKVTKDMYGFNIIRGKEGVFDGRNYYINLKQNLDDVYDYLKALPVSEQSFEAKVDYPITMKETHVEESPEIQTSLNEEMEIREVSCDEDCCEEGECCENNACKEEAVQEKIEENSCDAAAESMPSAGKGSKDKPGVIRIDGAKKKDRDVEHMIQYSSVEKAILNAIKF